MPSSGTEHSGPLMHHKQDPEDNEYATPPRIWRPLARAVDGFDLDAASGAEPTPIAPDRYTAEHDGLAQAWLSGLADDAHDRTCGSRRNPVADEAETAFTAILSMLRDNYGVGWPRLDGVGGNPLEVDLP